MIEIRKVNEVYLQIDCEKGEALEIKDLFSCYAPNFMFHPRFKAKIWDGRISFFDLKNRLLPIGLLENLLEFIYDKGYEFNISSIDSFVDEDVTEDLIDSFLNLIFENSKFEPRDYQKTAIKNALYSRRGVVESPTGSGKSLIIYSIIRYILEVTQGKILLVVPNITLVNQMFTDFKDYGWNDIENHVDILYSGKKITNKRVLISTYQSIYKKGVDFFSEFDAILMDECHGLNLDSKSLKSIMIKCENAIYRLGFTGTLPDDDVDIFTVYGYLGQQIFSLTTNELIDEGVLSNISIANVIFRYPEEIIKQYKNRTYPEEERLVESFNPRFKVLNWVFNNLDDKENTLILCRHIEHLKAIETHLLNTLDDKYKVAVIYGAIDGEKREEIRKLMNKEENMVLIGSYTTMSTGVNIPRIHNIVFASSYKSKIKILQSIGRGLRQAEGKDGLILWDIVDDLRWKNRKGKYVNNYLFDHFNQRLGFYTKNKFNFYNFELTVTDLK